MNGVKALRDTINLLVGTWNRLQTTRTGMYKMRMGTEKETLDVATMVQSFFHSLQSPAGLLELFDHMSDVFLFVKDRDGRFMKVNRTMWQARGLASDAEIIGKTDLDLHPPFWALKYREEDAGVMAQAQPLVDCMWLVPDVRGKLESFVSTKVPLFDRQQECIGIAGFRRALQSAEERNRPESRGLQAAVRYMSNHYAEPLEIRQIAVHSGLSHSQFNRRFRAIYRMSPSVYLQRVRVHEASARLVDSDVTLSQIALDVGFYDQAHLTRTFKRFLGVSPSEFRRIQLQAVGTSHQLNSFRGD